jgi:hypothetical protein
MALNGSVTRVRMFFGDPWPLGWWGKRPDYFVPLWTLSGLVILVGLPVLKVTWHPGTLQGTLQATCPVSGVLTRRLNAFSVRT